MRTQGTVGTGMPPCVLRSCQQGYQLACEIPNEIRNQLALYLLDSPGQTTGSSKQLLSKFIDSIVSCLPRNVQQRHSLVEDCHAPTRHPPTLAVLLGSSYLPLLTLCENPAGPRWELHGHVRFGRAGQLHGCLQIRVSEGETIYIYIYSSGV